MPPLRLRNIPSRAQTGFNALGEALRFGNTDPRDGGRVDTETLVCPLKNCPPVAAPQLLHYQTLENFLYVTSNDPDFAFSASIYIIPPNMLPHVRKVGVSADFNATKTCDKRAR
ncbi:hypothetical protein H6P81_013977 [Aristolochia fimbriata]|uniref:Uncharacterized protein n=1 Tax=Aristolochia fimbriata TaxID=158543 RepID=A0AAV7EHT5_ARIFI|nr:hypothetical protein H6P81_013977 [Aristolochia fimbriata]